MAFLKGFALGDVQGPEVFLDGAKLGDALVEAERYYPKHTPIKFDGDLLTVENEGGDDFTPNDSRKMPSFAHKMSGLGRYSADQVMRLSEKEAHAILLPFFRMRIESGIHEGKTVKAYDSVAKMRKVFLTQNAKLAKGKEGLHGIEPGSSRGPNLLPHRLALDVSKKKLPMQGMGFCVGSNDACRATCLVYSGNNPVADKQVPVKLARTESLLLEPVAWLRMFMAAIQWHVEESESKGLKPYVRPNVLSDIPWELVFPDMFDLFPELQFYDYTKVPWRDPRAHNYDLTFSFSGTNDRRVESELKRGHRVAVVFWLQRPCARYKKSKSCDSPSELTFLGHRVIDGDTHDFRPLDPPGSVIGLSYKIPTAAGKRMATPPKMAEKFIVPTFRDPDTGALLVAGTPAQLGAASIFDDVEPTTLELAG